MNIIFQINGGIGKCVAATAVCEVIKKKYPSSKLVVISGYSDVFLNNPNVDRAYNFGGTSYFYEEYIENKETLVFAHDPYLEINHIQHREHLIETWCRVFNLEYSGESPKIYLTDRERKFYQNKYKSDKPILLIQPNGGAQTDLKYSWARDLPEKIVNRIIKEFKQSYNILHVKREDQIRYIDTFEITDNFRALCVLCEMSDKRVLIDSFLQHVSAAMGKSSTVCWVVNKPNVFGYNLHDNVICNDFTRKAEIRGAYLNKFNISGDLLEFPYNTEFEIFDEEKIIDSIKRINS
jgi:hypothetical protein